MNTHGHKCEHTRAQVCTYTHGGGGEGVGARAGKGRTDLRPVANTAVPFCGDYGYTMHVQLSSCFFSCSGRRIPFSLNEPPIHVIGGALGCVGWTRVFVSRDWVFQFLVAEALKPHFYICTYTYVYMYT